MDDGLRLCDLMPGARVFDRMTPAQRRWLGDRLRGAEVAVFGATGAVGLEALALLDEAEVPAKLVRAYASERSVGRGVAYGEGVLEVRGVETALEVGSPGVGGARLAVLATPAEVSRTLAPALLARGWRVSDNSAAFREEALVLPEVNAAVVSGGTHLVASPNCTTAITLTAAEGLRRAVGIESIGITSYQAVSGAGLAAMEALVSETACATRGQALQGLWRAEASAFNIFPHESAVEEETGLCAEERKFLEETARLWQGAGAATDAACMRTPTLRTHLVVVRAHTRRGCGRAEALVALASGVGVRVAPDGPSALEASGRCEVLVGRVVADEGARTVRFVAAGDQLLKGAAWNALQNAALLAQRGRSSALVGAAD